MFNKYITSLKSAFSRQSKNGLKSVKCEKPNLVQYDGRLGGICMTTERITPHF